MKSRESAMFYLKKSNINAKGEVSIQLRITVNGKRFEVSANRKINPDQ